MQVALKFSKHSEDDEIASNIRSVFRHSPWSHSDQQIKMEKPVYSNSTLRYRNGFGQKAVIRSHFVVLMHARVREASVHWKTHFREKIGILSDANL